MKKDFGLWIAGLIIAIGIMLIVIAYCTKQDSNYVTDPGPYKVEREPIK